MIVKHIPIFLVSALVYLYLLVETNFYGMSCLGLAFTTFVFLLFVKDLGKSIPILELMVLLTCLQWILGPFLAYYLGNNHYKYYMSIPEPEYMDFVVPSLLIFAAGMLPFAARIGRFSVKVFKVQDPYINMSPIIPYLLIAAGLMAHTLAKYAPATLRFAFTLLDGLQFIAVIYFFHTKHRLRWPILFVVFGLNMSISLAIAMFHNILIWSALLFIYINIYLDLNFVSKMALIGFGFLCAFYIQTVKGEYREVVWKEKTTHEYQDDSNAEIFANMVMDQVEEEETFEDESFLEMMNTRLNQGWIISRVMYYIPVYEPFANGETIIDAIYSSLVPRFLAPGKSLAGGKINFERFTGYTLTEDTSMNVSILGEAYGNFGVTGSRWFMLIWGFFISGMFLLTLKMTNKYSTFWIWLPLIFAQVIKAETDMVTVLNYFTKAFIFTIVMFYSMKKFLGVRI